MDVSIYETAGFVADAALQASMEGEAAVSGMHENGPYVVLAALRKGDVTITIEQNTAHGQRFDPVCLISGPKGTAACNPDDTALALQLATDLS